MSSSIFVRFFKLETHPNHKCKVLLNGEVLHLLTQWFIVSHFWQTVWKRTEHKWLMKFLNSTPPPPPEERQVTHCLLNGGYEHSTYTYLRERQTQQYTKRYTQYHPHPTKPSHPYKRWYGHALPTGWCNRQSHQYLPQLSSGIRRPCPSWPETSCKFLMHPYIAFYSYQSISLQR